MRVHGIEQLAAWVLADQGWNPEHVQAMKASGERRDVTLKRPVPLYFVYITAWATRTAWSSSAATSTRKTAWARCAAY